MYTYIYMHTHICIYTYQNFYHVLSPLGHFHGSLKKHTWSKHAGIIPCRTPSVYPPHTHSSLSILEKSSNSSKNSKSQSE